MKRLLILLVSLLLIGGCEIMTEEFKDVDPTLNGYIAVRDLKDQGYVVGVGDNEFKPFDTVTRAEMSVFISRASHGVHYKPYPPVGNIPDVDASYWGAKWIECAIGSGLMDLYPDGNFYPHNPATRMDVAVLFWLLVK